MRVGRLNKSVIQYGQWLLANTGASNQHGDRGDTPARELEAEASTRPHAPNTINGENSTNEHAFDTSTATILSDDERRDATKTDTEPTTASDSPAKRLKLDSLYYPSRAGCWVELFQAGRPLTDPCRAFLTPEALQTIKKKELTADAVLFFFMKMAQFLPYQRLRVLPPNFYNSVVQKSKLGEWQPFLDSNLPVVCLQCLKAVGGC